MDLFFRVFQHLIFRSDKWSLVIVKQLREFFEGLSGLGADYKTFVDLVYLDLFPGTTRELELWETQFGITNKTVVEADRRAAIASAWQATGGQSPSYIQTTLQAAGFDVFIHEWWELPVVGAPVARNPQLVLSDGNEFTGTAGNGVSSCGDGFTSCGSSSSPTGFAIVNNPDPANLPAITADSALWPYFIYLGGETFPSIASVDVARRNEFETLCLKICPTQNWLGMLIEYT
jgi:hypothetical protein